MPEGLLAAAFFAALCAVSPAVAQIVPPDPPCNEVSGSTVTCTGNLAPGVAIASGSPYDTLNIGSLTTAITPGAGTSGISFSSDGNIMLSSNTGSYGITVVGANIAGIYAQSGSGSISLISSGAVSVFGESTYGISLTSLGGSLNLTTSNAITTNGASAIGIWADAGNGSVNLTNSGAISTSGTNALGIFAQDYGAGYNVILNNSGAITTNGYFAWGIWAFSAAGSVNLTNSGALSTSGDTGWGIFATGDSLTLTNSGRIATSGYEARAITADVGNGVSFANSGALSTSGESAYGVYARSAFGDIALTNSGAIETTGAGAIGIVAHADLGFLSLTNLGRITTAGGIAGYTDRASGIEAHSGNGMSLTNSGAISTYGDGAYGIDARSAAGNMGLINSGSVTTGGYAASGIVAYSAGDLDFINSGSIMTSGETAFGIYTLSSGNLNLTNSGAITTSGLGAGGAFAYAGSGLVSLTNSGAISTSGDSAHGLNAQSSDGSISLANSGALSTSGDATIGILAYSVNEGLRLTNSGNITTAGTYADGILAASGSLTGSPFSVSVTAGRIAATGLDASGIDAIGVEPTVNMAITVVNGAQVIGGTRTGAGIQLAGGGDNTVTNYGTITSASGLSGYAILGVSTSWFFGTLSVGNNTVDNYGLIAGNADLGAGANAFNNKAGGVFLMGPAVSAGAGNTLTNSGLLMAGMPAGTVQTTALAANLVQTGTGQLLVDANWATGQASRIEVTGSATLAGSVLVNLQNVSSLNQQFTILNAVGGIANNGIAPVNTAAVSYQLSFPDANGMVLAASIDFLGNGTLNPSQASLAQSINSIVARGGSPGFNPAMQALLTLPTQQSLAAALNQLSPDAYAKAATALIPANFAFSNSLLSCSVAEGGFAFIAEGQCMWAQVRDRTLSRSASPDIIGSQERAGSTSGGVQMAISKDWFAGAGFGYESSRLTTDTRATTSANWFEAGAVVKYNPGALLLAAAATGGAGTDRTLRPISFGGFAGIAQSNNSTGYAGSLLRAAYLIDLGSWYLKPVADAYAMYLDMGGFSETGAGGAGLTSSGIHSTMLALSPSLEIGTQYKLLDGIVLRPFLRVGTTWFGKSALGIGASFEGAPPGAAPFYWSNPIDRVLGDVVLGMDVLGNDGINLKFTYDSHFGATTLEQSVSGKMSFKF